MRPFLFLIALVSISPSFGQSSEKPVLNGAFGIKAGMNLSFLSQTINADQNMKAGIIGGIYIQAN